MSAHLLLDVVLVAIVVGHALHGWRVGGVAGASATAGALGGGALALAWAPQQIAAHLPHLGAGPRGLVLLAVVLLAASLGELLLGRLGTALRARTRTPGLRRLDALAGAVVSALVTSLVVTTLASALRPVLPTQAAAAIQGSQVLPVMDRVVPDAAQRWAANATRTLTQGGFPRVFSGLQSEPVIPAKAPDQRAARTAAVRAAAASVVKVRSDACALEHEGSGWVVAPHRVVTNAHVVAGTSATTVQVTGQGPQLAARVVAYDPKLDLAVLDVENLKAPVLRRAAGLANGASAAVAGFPLDGGYTVRAARIRGVVMASGDDIYGRAGAGRQVYSLAAAVQPGNSGGPLLTDQGTVAGTIFAKSTVDDNTGYALTDQATEPMLAQAASYRGTVSAGACSTG